MQWVSLHFLAKVNGSRELVDARQEGSQFNTMNPLHITAFSGGPN
jgi:hypothetical protein